MDIKKSPNSLRRVNFLIQGQIAFMHEEGIGKLGVAVSDFELLYISLESVLIFLK